MKKKIKRSSEQLIGSKSKNDEGRASVNELPDSPSPLTAFKDFKTSLPTFERMVGEFMKFNPNRMITPSVQHVRVWQRVLNEFLRNSKQLVDSLDKKK